jgi:hypothetical protein
VVLLGILVVVQLGWIGVFTNTHRLSGELREHRELPGSISDLSARPTTQHRGAKHGFRKHSLDTVERKEHLLINRCALPLPSSPHATPWAFLT